MITEIHQLSDTQIYSYADYLLWQLKERVELIAGRVCKMSPAPNMHHQRVSGRIFGEIYIYLRDKKCQIFHPPFDVRFPKASDTTDNQVFDMVQPDLCVICDAAKLDKRGCIGAPDLVVEILSPGNTRREMKEKYQLYEKHGVKEYWLIYPLEQSVHVYCLNEQGKYQSMGHPLSTDDVLCSTVLIGFELDLSKVFEDITDW
jgi:Uma2 family endonuclease